MFVQTEANKKARENIPIIKYALALDSIYPNPSLVIGIVTVCPTICTYTS